MIFEERYLILRPLSTVGNLLWLTDIEKADSERLSFLPYSEKVEGEDRQDVICVSQNYRDRTASVRFSKESEWDEIPYDLSQKLSNSCLYEIDRVRCIMSPILPTFWGREAVLDLYTSGNRACAFFGFTRNREGGIMDYKPIYNIKDLPVRYVDRSDPNLSEYGMARYGIPDLT